MHSIAGEPMLDGRYQLEQRLGQGGMGIVFKARHLFLKTAHAIKIILPDLVGNDPMLITRFRQEAMAAAAVRHQNIIAVTDFGVARGTMPFLVMEFVQGRSLHDILEKQGRLSAPEALDIMAGVAAGVGAAHRHGIVHRDLKPLNIMLQDGLPTSESIKVLDFGLAKIKSGELLGSFVAAQTTGLMGSPFYMAPEQWSEEEPDRRADIYSLGVILYQMLAGEVPFRGPSIPAIMKKHLMSDPPAFSELGAQVQPAIESVVRRTLEKDPEKRPQTVEEFVAELRGAIAVSQSDSLARTQLFSPDVLPAQTLIEQVPPQTSQNVVSVPTIETERKAQEEQSAARLRLEQEEKEAARLRSEDEARQAAARRAEQEEQTRREAEQQQRQQEEADLARRRAEEEEAARRAAAAAEESQRKAAEAERQQREREIAAAEEQRRREEHERQQRLLDEHRKAEQARAEAEERSRREQLEKQAAEQQRAREEQARLERERQEQERAEAAARLASTTLTPPTVIPTAQHPPGTQTGQYGQTQNTLAPQHPFNPNTAPTLMPDSFPPPITQGGQPPQGFTSGAQHSQANLQSSQPQFQTSQSSLNPSIHAFPGVTSAAPRKSRAPLIIGIVVLLGLMSIGGAATLMMLSGDATNDPPASPTPTSTSPTPRTSPGGGGTTGRADMVSIPGGTFQMGRAGGSPQETPVHSETVAPFFMDRTEVTNAEYAEFIRATNRTPPGWPSQSPPQGQERWPVTNVNYDDAVAFARWRSQRDGVEYRLPTEAEWEFAARGGGSNLYPWGNSWSEDRANLGTGQGRDVDFPKPVGSYPTGATQTGLLDMVGNVWEWTSSSATFYPGSDQTVQASQRNYAVVRGGSHQSLYPASVTERGSRSFPATWRTWIPRSTRDGTVGFRLVRSGS
jgi:formylglycine-generating enzyme required for sulfatase activity/serine/threonine protein kinase